MLTRNEFALLNDLRKHPQSTQRTIAERTGLSLGTVNTSFKDMRDRKYLEDASVTATGMKALEPYRVDNAIIMAAGVSSRFVPLSYDRPKGTFIVRGEVLIERIIKQLQEAGIQDITLVVGYMKEQFFYLEDAFGVKIVINEEYLERNNNSSLKVVENKLLNSYIVTSDNYFVENVFEPYVYKAFYSSIFVEGHSDEWGLRTGSGGRINKVIVGGGNDEWVMMGHAYWDTSFSKTFASILNEVYDRPETKSKLWEEIFADNVKHFDMEIKKHPDGVIYEFDSLEEVRAFDPNFLDNIDSEVFNNICSILGCAREDIRDTRPVVGGLSNFSFYFRVGEKEYVYRHPGQATQGLLNRAAEAEAEAIALELELDKTFIYQDPHKGWKISKFVHITEPFDYFNEEHVKTAFTMARKLHNSGKTIDNIFNLRTETEKIKEKLIGTSQLNFPDYDELATRAARLYEYVEKTDPSVCLCHNDFYEPNILISNGEYFVIDWEYSGMTNYANDIGSYVVSSNYTYDDVLWALKMYFERDPSPAELRHCIAYISLAGYYWFVWALNKEASNESVGEWLYLWYRYAKDFGVIAKDLINAATE